MEIIPLTPIILAKVLSIAPHEPQLDLHKSQP